MLLISYPERYQHVQYMFWDRYQSRTSYTSGPHPNEALEIASVIYVAICVYFSFVPIEGFLGVPSSHNRPILKRNDALLREIMRGGAWAQ